MKIIEIQQEREKWLLWKDIKPIREKIADLPNFQGKLSISDSILIDLENPENENIIEIAKTLKPWRKGPFQIGSLFIDSEWKSQIKYSIIEPFLDIQNKMVGDIGCNNGYYMFRMLEKKPHQIIGFDPSPLFRTQFDFINHFAKTEILYELLGVEHLTEYKTKFDTLICLGVLYHRSDPIATLKSLRNGLKKGGTLIVDTFYIDGDDEVCLFPEDRYSKIPNIYFIPTVSALRNWVKRAKFSSFEIIAELETDESEQRKTEWIEGESLGEFLDPNDKNKTVEGYPAPKRIYMKLVK
jgi:tRNA (mo5U34)-methyltransferase